ncbi:flagellar protein FlaG [Vreelandella utahensis]|uniref:flagellar protein FlaG n=1 Tax=Vreelandella halophila TaxID=86177 RepID=UPI000984FE90|nr:flagellar protein FlaG [Halomonas utahensis]
MSDVNLNSPDSNPRPSGERGLARASSSQPADSKAGNVSSISPLKTERSEVSQAEKSERLNEAMREELDDAVSRLNDFVQSVQRDLEFEVNDETGQTVVRVIDQQTEEVVRQIPDELAMRLAENLQQDEPLSLLNIRV